jgi:tetratricopeptide (TPR) repeat protein
MFRTSRLLFFCFALSTQETFGATSEERAFEFEPNPYFQSAGELKHYLMDNSDVFETPDTHLSLDFGRDGSWRLDLAGLKQEGMGYVFMDYAYDKNKVVGGAGGVAGIVFCDASGTPPKEEPSCYGMPTVSKEKLEKAAVVARYFVRERLPSMLEYSWKDALRFHRHGNKKIAANSVAPLVQAAPWKVIPITAKNVELYNDLGFFLEQGQMYKEAISVLQEVTRAVPDRAVAFLNLGDAYVGVPDIPHAKEAYKQYQALMQKSGNGAKVPKRIQKYLQ